VGILMARLVLRELMRPDADAHFRAFLVKVRPTAQTAAPVKNVVTICCH
jgi:hypothetical protein